MEDKLSLRDLLDLREYYQKKWSTYRGGCMNQEQADAREKIELIECKIKELTPCTTPL